MKLRYFYFCFFIFARIFSLSAAETTMNDKKIPVLLVEPSFEHPPIATSIPGAQRTVIAAGFIQDDAEGKPTTSFLKPSWKTTRSSEMNDFVKAARSKLSVTLATLHPSFLRDENQVIQVAILESTNPLTASTILAPDFSERFINIFGPELHIAIPSTHRVYIFSKLASPLKNIAQAIRDDYKFASEPLTTEIFELGHGRLRTIGSLD